MNQMKKFKLNLDSPPNLKMSAVLSPIKMSNLLSPIKHSNEPGRFTHIALKKDPMQLNISGISSDSNHFETETFNYSKGQNFLARRSYTQFKDHPLKKLNLFLPEEKKLEKEKEIFRKSVISLRPTKDLSQLIFDETPIIDEINKTHSEVVVIPKEKPNKKSLKIWKRLPKRKRNLIRLNLNLSEKVHMVTQKIQVHQTEKKESIMIYLTKLIKKYQLNHQEMIH